MRLEHPVLLGVRKSRVQRQHLGGLRDGAARDLELLVQRVRRVADLPLAGEEHEHIAGAFGLQFVHGVADGGDLVAVRTVALLLEQGPVPHLDRVGAPADLNDGGV